MDRRSFFQWAAGASVALGLPGAAFRAPEHFKINSKTMRQVTFNTEATGISPKYGHRIVELACVEIIDCNKSGRTFHRYINPEREIDEGAAAVHGLTRDRLRDEPKFAEIAPDFLDFINGANLLIRNAPFHVGFLHKELELAELPALNNCCPNLFDILKWANEMHPGKQNSLPALGERYQIDYSCRTLPGAMGDAKLLAEVYLALMKAQAGRAS